MKALDGGDQKAAEAQGEGAAASADATVVVLDGTQKKLVISY